MFTIAAIALFVLILAAAVFAARGAFAAHRTHIAQRALLLDPYRTGLRVMTTARGRHAIERRLVRAH